MQEMEVFDSLISYTDIRINSCREISHDGKWHENGCKADYDIWVVLDGEISITIQGDEHILRAQDVVFLYPFVLYEAHAISDSCTFIYIHFDFKIGENIRALDEFALAGFISHQAINDEVQAFVKNFGAYKDKEPLSFFALKGYFTILLSKIILCQYRKNKLLNLKRSNSKALIRLNPVLSYITEHLHEPIYTKEIAEITNMSEKYFITFFKNTIGITPGVYITHAKMNKALDYLYEYKYSIKEIASLLGYPDQYIFSKAFKKEYKAAPSKLIY
jgi:AraC family transcriptional regulator